MTSHVSVLGANGRAGQAICSALRSAGHHVVGLVRDPGRCPELHRLGVELRQGDATLNDDVARLIQASDAAVVAVTPFSAPPTDFTGFDESYYEHVVNSVAGAASQRPFRLVTVGLYATLTLTDNTLVMDDPELFPPGLRPFARAHARELDALSRTVASLDWITITPTAALQRGDAPGYRLTCGPVAREDILTPTTYCQLGQAAADQITSPTIHHAAATLLGAQPRDIR